MADNTISRDTKNTVTTQLQQQQNTLVLTSNKTAPANTTSLLNNGEHNYNSNRGSTGATGAGARSKTTIADSTGARDGAGA